MTPLSPREQLSAGALALLFHVVLFLALVFSVSWRQTPNLPAVAELWASLPEPRAVPPARVEAKLVPPPPKPEAPPEPVKADIAVQQAKKKPEPPKPEPKPEPAKKPEAKPEPKKAEPDKRQIEREAQKKAVDKALTEQADSELAQEAAQLNQMRQQQQTAAARDKLIADYQDRIRQKIRGYLRLPHNLTGNPEAVFQVFLLPDGEVQRVVLARTSGQPAYDQEVERAIIKASPLPMPPDPAAAASFRNGLMLKFRPKEG